MPSKYTYIDGVAVNYLHSGATTLPDVPPDFRRGLPLLFLHAAGSNANTWHKQLAHFGAAHSPVAFDYPGHGRSGSTEGLATIRAYAEFTQAFAGAVGLARPVLIGRSMGGVIAMEVALAAPDRVHALVLVATAAKFTLNPDTIATWRNVMLGRAQQPFTTEAFSPKTDFAIMREAWMEQVKTDPRVRHGDLVACAAVDLSPRLGEIRVPTLIIAGRDDTITPVAQAEALQHGIAGAQLVVIDDAGHSIPTEKPDEFNRAVEHFLGGL